MTTTPTQLWTVNYQGEAVLTKDGLKIGGTLEPATHDKLIAAMPRCGTCDKREDDGLCTRTMSYVRVHFGCTEHKEHSNGK